MTDRGQEPVRKLAKAAKKAAPRPGPRADKDDGEAAVFAKTAAMPAPYRAMGERLHALILPSAPALPPTLYYGMLWCAKDGKRVRSFRADKHRTFGLTEQATVTREEGAPHQLGLVVPRTSPRWTTRPRPSSPPSCARPRAEGANQFRRSMPGWLRTGSS